MINEINTLKSKLDKAINDKLECLDILKISQELDCLIVRYMRDNIK